MSKYNGHKNWNHWNVSLWINNDEGLYNMARDFVRAYKPRRKAAEAFVETMRDTAHWQTPDGAPYTVSSVMAAMRGM